MAFRKTKYPSFLEDDVSVGKKVLIFFWEIIKVVVISLAIIVPVRYFLIKPFYVKGASMEPNYYDHEYLIIDELTYRFALPARGETVVFRAPIDKSQYFIKRIIGLPEEKIKVAGGKIYIFNQKFPEGSALTESYLLPAMKTLGEVEVQLGPDEYYLLGDNRISSLDSRIFGPVQRADIVGRTFLRGWPIDRIGVIKNDWQYNL
ncbi:MAG: signal peptidase I [Candidatus Buchananbacteria bacterium RIFCSPHIGHO2_01_FULL_39_14]|uniref:Signal peptidase I n=2 Tax=Candidatus Buchananiibacteriota TaxID=1817903 RepID=A0A1G1YM98_9BACT|nr:MAG: signal peptidase I [Candidatus Buchananbacteria bacterium RIFCSPHIGHO2_01_FULL_39_14]OGY48377.1 MAG: signal peptidase I [Candidatus Buchananbacteria bacterium RIFCSPHIGHO2_02_FULL_39_17]OGY53411.1 MAG: signal peptidase I [Candidatus Buchananbacteria bacterium RIFCSPLOWO2_01_FULL_40_23b]